LILGFLIQQKSRIVIISHTLFIGLATGLCGSITTFSGVMLEANIQFFNLNQSSRTVLLDVMAGIAFFLTAFGMSFVGYFWGRNLGSLIPPCAYIIKYQPPTWFDSKSKYPIGFICFALTALIITLAFSLDLTTRVAYSLLLAPVGTLIRWRIGRLNIEKPNFSSRHVDS